MLQFNHFFFIHLLEHFYKESLLIYYFVTYCYSSYRRGRVLSLYLAVFKIEQHLSPHWSPVLICLIWPGRWVSPSSQTTPCVCLLKPSTWSLGRTGWPSLTEEDHPSVKGMWVTVLEPPDKFSSHLLMMRNLTLKNHYEIMDLNIFNVFQSIDYYPWPCSICCTFGQWKLLQLTSGPFWQSW